MKRMMMMFSAMLASLVMSADTWTDLETGIEWTYTVDTSLRVHLNSVSSNAIGAVEIPSKLGEHSVVYIGESAFYKCNKLEALFVPSSVTCVEKFGFSGCVSKTIDFAAPRLNVQDYGFQGCSANVSLAIRSARYDSLAFNGFSGRLSVRIPDGDTSVAELAFWDCQVLHDVTIPASVMSIGKDAFASCTHLYKIVFEGDRPDFGKNALANVEGAQVYVVRGSEGWGVVPGTWQGFQINYTTPAVTVSFYNPEGELSAALKQYEVGKPYGFLPSACCSTGQFEGWYTAPEQGVLVTGFSNATESVTSLYAHWTNDVVTSTTVTNTVELTNTVVSTVCETNTVTETLYQTNTVEKTETVFVTNVIEQVHEVEVEKIVTVEKVETIFETNYVDVVVTNYVGVGDGEVGRVSDEVLAFEPDEGFDGSQKRTLNGIVFDDDGVFCGLAQIATAKATSRGVTVSGFVMLSDGKKQSLRSVRGAIEGGLLEIKTKVGKIGEMDLTIGANGFRGQIGELTVVSANPDDESGVLKGSMLLYYFDPKTARLKTKSIKVSGVALEGDASGMIDVRGKEPKSFAAEIE